MPEKLSAAKLAEFASDRFAALCWAGAIGRSRPQLYLNSSSYDK
jgi:hypothetical protein